MGGSKNAVNPPLGQLIAGPPHGLEHNVPGQAVGLGITERPG